MNEKEKLKQVLDDAEQAFWSEVAKGYPEITTGDFPPIALFEIQNAMEKAIRRWLMFNKK